MGLVNVPREHYYWQPRVPMVVDSDVYTYGGGAPPSVSPVRYKYRTRDRDALKERPRQHTMSHPPVEKKEHQCGAIVAQPSDTDIAPAAVEWRDTRYRNRHEPPGTAYRPSRTGREHRKPHGSTGQPQKGRRTARGSTPGDALEPERYQGRVARLTHNGVLASNSSPGPQSTFFNRVSSSRDEWVGARGSLQCGAGMGEKAQQ